LTLSQETSFLSNGQKVLQGGRESSLANHPGTILALGYLFTKEIIKRAKN
jgi:hypothetical protein